MTDKQIIIDGVDVSECEAIDTHSGWCSFWEENCAKNPDCIHKKYLRKKQECEELKKEKAEIKKYLGISHKTILERLEELTDFRDRDKEELDRLKATLAEIKEIAEIHKDNKCAICPKFDECFEHPFCDDIILQKISEVKE